MNKYCTSSTIVKMMIIESLIIYLKLRHTASLNRKIEYRNEKVNENETY